jgi:hypothetical protein
MLSAEPAKAGGEGILKKTPLLAALCLLLSTLPLSADQPKNLVVSDFSVSGTGDSGFGKVLGDIARDVVGGYEEVVLVDRENLDKIMEEQALQLSGLSPEDKAVKAGKLAGATLLLAGSVGPVPGGFSVSAKVIDIETGMVSAVDSRMARGDASSIPSLSRFAVRTVMDKMRPPKASDLALRSALLPGWGQFSAKRPAKGWIFRAGAILSVGAGAASGYMLWRSYDTYKKASDPSADFDRLWGDVELWRDALIGSAASLGLVWALNVGDAGLFCGGSK